MNELTDVEIQARIGEIMELNMDTFMSALKGSLDKLSSLNRETDNADVEAMIAEIADDVGDYGFKAHALGMIQGIQEEAEEGMLSRAIGRWVFKKQTAIQIVLVTFLVGILAGTFIVPLL